MKAESVTIRSFAMTDYDGVVQLWQECGLPFRPEGRDSRDAVAAELERGCTVFRVGLIRDKLISAVFGTHDGRKGWINRLAVHPEYRKSGIGRRMVQEVESALNDMGIRITACLVEDWNQESLQFFRHIGYCSHDDIQYLSKREHSKV